ncbi:SMI1/KNR4 family protein [Motilibacter peucedani]|nr:SMI1/KNR4 family protein [Motilibacter peucedani]
MVEVSALWATLRDWCRINAPATLAALHPPASDAELEAAQLRTGLMWPQSLVASLREHDGAEVWSGDVLLAFTPMGAAEIAEMWFEFTAFPWGGTEDPHAGLAGEVPSHPFSSGWLPVAQMEGAFYLLDLRPGPLHGCVLYWTSDGDGMSEEPLVSSYEELVRVSVLGITDGLKGPEGMIASVVEGRVQWNWPEAFGAVTAEEQAVLDSRYR